MSNMTSQEVTEVIITEGSLRSYVNVEVHYQIPLPLQPAQQKKREHKKSGMAPTFFYSKVIFYFHSHPLANTSQAVTLQVGRAL